jgi:aminoglycoside 6'-N-acetyltransferase I
VDRISIERVGDADFGDWLDMALELWPDYDRDEMEEVLSEIKDSESQAAFICRGEDGTAIGFMNLSTRTDYVEGSDSSPVGYVEGIYIREAHRKSGLGRRMVATAERWTIERGYTELGSDAELPNVNSQRFHEAVGFTEANRNVHYIKPLRP